MSLPTNPSPAESQQDSARLFDAFRALVESSPDIAFVTDRSGNCLYCNDAAIHFAGRPQSQIIGQVGALILGDSAADTLRLIDDRVIATGRMATEECSISRQNHAHFFQIRKMPFLDANGTIQGIVTTARENATAFQAERTIRALTVFNAALGQDYFRSLVSYLCDVCNVRIAFVGQLVLANEPFVQTLSVFQNGQHQENFRYALKNTPCEKLVFHSICYYPSGIQTEFPDDTMLVQMGMDSYLGIPLFGSSGKPIGLIAMLHDASMPLPDQSKTILEIVAARTASEMERCLVEEQLRASEQSYRQGLHFREAIIRTAGEGICVCHAIPHHPFVEFSVWNDRMTDITGFSVDEINRFGWYQSLYPDPELQKLAIARMDRMRASDDLVAEEWEITRKDGARRTLIISTSRVEMSDGGDGIVAIMQDVTDRLQDALKLSRTADLLRAVAEGTTEAIFVKDIDGKYLFVNNGVAKFVGKSCQEIIGQNDTFLFDSESARNLMERDRNIMRHGIHETNEEQLTSDGITRVYLATKGPYRNEQGEVIGLIGISRDITERKRAEESVYENEERYRKLFETITDAIFVLDSKGKIHSANSAAARMHGYTIEELLKLNIRDLDSHRDSEKVADRIERLRAGENLTFEVEHRRKDGTIFPLEAVATPFLFQGETFILALDRDISDRKTAERAMRLTQFSIDRSVESVFWINRYGVILYVNDAACATLEYPREELIGACVWNIDSSFPESQWAAHWDEITRRGSFSFESEHETKNGRKIKTEVTVNYLQFDGQEYNCAVMRDITQQKLLEQQLMQSQKMEAIGQLAGGIAHDFNNLLTVINGRCALLLADYPADTPLTNSLGEILEAGNRAAQLTTQLLAFSRRSQVEMKRVHINNVVAKIEKMLRRLIEERIELIVDLDPNVQPILADTIQIEQVLMNLAVNARDAMPSGGQLEIETKLIAKGELIDSERVNDPSRQYVQLVVRDNGTGMTDDVLSHIFEPFFTTKETGKGTGLGLAVVYGIVQQNKGSIRVESRVGIGTTFKLYFPVADAPVPKINEVQPIASSENSETILLVEDESGVRKIAKMALEQQGYVVLEAVCGSDALAIAEDDNQVIDLLLTDIIMPGMNGRELADLLRQRRPNLPIMYMSGYHEDPQIRDIYNNQRERFLPKPFSVHSFLQCVQDAIRNA
jgi:PAS domain S-box-containing protein